MRRDHLILKESAGNYPNGHCGWAREALGDAYKPAVFEALFDVTIRRKLCDLTSTASIKQTCIQLQRLDQTQCSRLLEHNNANVKYLLGLPADAFSQQINLHDDQLEKLRALTPTQQVKLLSLDDELRDLALSKTQETIDIILKAPKKLIADMFSAGSPPIDNFIRVYKKQYTNAPGDTTTFSAYILTKLVYTAKLFKDYEQAELTQHLDWITSLDPVIASGLAELDETHIATIRQAKAWHIAAGQDCLACVQALDFINTANLCEADDHETQHAMLRNLLRLSADQRTKLQGLYNQLASDTPNELTIKLAHDCCLQLLSLSLAEQQALLSNTLAVINSKVMRLQHTPLPTMHDAEAPILWGLAQRFGVDETLRRLDMQTELARVLNLKARAIDLNSATIFSCRFFSLGGRGAGGLARPEGTYNIEESMKAVSLPEHYPLEADNVDAVDLQIEAARTVLITNASISLSKPVDEVNRDGDVEQYYFSIRESWPKRVSTASPTRMDSAIAESKRVSRSYE